MAKTATSETHALFYGRKHPQAFQVMGYEAYFSEPAGRGWDRLFRTLDNDRCISDTAHVSSLSGEILYASLIGRHIVALFIYFL